MHSPKVSHQEPYRNFDAEQQRRLPNRKEGCKPRRKRSSEFRRTILSISGFTPRRVLVPVHSARTSTSQLSAIGQPFRQLVRQFVNIDTAVVIGHVDLATIDYRRVEFVEKKLAAPALGVPQDPQRSTRRKVHRIVDE